MNLNVIFVDRTSANAGFVRKLRVLRSTALGILYLVCVGVHVPQDTTAPGTVIFVLIVSAAVPPVCATSAPKKAAPFCVVFAATEHFARNTRTTRDVAAVELRASATTVPMKHQRIQQRKPTWNSSALAPDVPL
ncbi:hypothetical protein DEU56DRAFT_826120 [Suillus clintonianus]|uniref:uncharacterized protein n=1 Tax=Suillus clintonianus TaxID=1904413 RepID=UPI001B86E482|nr:uncharacterized protein DEU56DRAFT_826120 [Suillus clintonianus]KAG2125043.1 hypothetical protein DEU56DRAFT_826120 [Suillus clintonianus]